VCDVQLDAKNSPLALLAQTCSSIGKDPTPPLATNPSHKLAPGSAKDSSSISTHHHHHNHHNKDDKVRPKSESPQSRAGDHRLSIAKCPGRDRLKESTRPGAAGSTLGKAQSSPKAGSRTSGIKDSSERMSPVDGISLSSRSLIRDGKPTAAAAVVSSSSVGAALQASSNASGGKSIASSLSSSLFDVGADSVQRFAALHQQLSLAVAAAAAAGRGSIYGPTPPLFPLDQHAFAGGAAPTTPALYPAGLPAANPFPLVGPQMDPLQLQQLYAAAAAAQSPSLYADYVARLKAATSSTACKDPFCVRCPLGGPGCGASSSVPSTAAADKHPGGGGSSLLPSVGAAGSSMLAPPLPFLPAASLHALLLQQMSAAAAAATSGGNSATGDALSGTAAPSSVVGAGTGTYTCSWVDGAADFCGMRFNSSDELLQHLRVHASAADPSGASLPPHPAALAALTASFPLGLGSSVPRLSPTPLGDVQPPTSASAFGPMPHGFSPSSSRYHPYKSPSAPAFSSPGGVPSLATGLPGASAAPPGAPPLLPPALAAFYSPYAALYGHRLGAAAVGP